jgi:hypothetical protein
MSASLGIKGDPPANPAKKNMPRLEMVNLEAQFKSNFLVKLSREVWSSQSIHHDILLSALQK